MIIKQIVSPFQKVLLSKRLCVGCTHPLERSRKIAVLTPTKTLHQCKCKRRYIYDKELGNFRRATFEEERLFIEQKKQ